MEKSALISNCGKYRYVLNRVWNINQQMVCFVMLNPSTADAFDDDPTIRRCISFAKKWGYGGIHVVNLFAFRSTNPKMLLEVENPIGELNESYIKTYIHASVKTICAWGNNSIVQKLLKKFPSYTPLEVEELYCLGKNAKGDPKHPLYLKGDLTPVEFKI